MSNNWTTASFCSHLRKFLHETSTDTVLLAAIEQFKDQTTDKVLIAALEEYAQHKRHQPKCYHQLIVYAFLLQMLELKVENKNISGKYSKSYNPGHLDMKYLIVKTLVAWDSHTKHMQFANS